MKDFKLKFIKSVLKTDIKIKINSKKYKYQCCYLKMSTKLITP